MIRAYGPLTRAPLSSSMAVGTRNQRRCLGAKQRPLGEPPQPRLPRGEQPGVRHRAGLSGRQAGAGKAARASGERTR